MYFCHLFPAALLSFVLLPIYCIQGTYEYVCVPHTCLCAALSRCAYSKEQDVYSGDHEASETDIFNLQYVGIIRDDVTQCKTGAKLSKKIAAQNASHQQDYHARA